MTLTDRCSFLCVSGQRGTIAMSMYEEHLCVVALTSTERGTQFFPLASYFLLCDLPLLFVYFQVNNGVLYCSSERLNDLITVSSTWELIPVGTRYS